MATHNGGTLGEGVVNELALDGLMLVFALFLVALNGLFVAAEFALVKIRATQVDRLVVEANGPRVARVSVKKEPA
jgi:CBS domain containing-hemolysin-like protein